MGDEFLRRDARAHAHVGCTPTRVGDHGPAAAARTGLVPANGHASSFLERIPAEILALVLRHLDMRTLCLLGACSSGMQHRVYVEDERLWHRIDFAPVPRLVDSALAAVLRRCNAREVTRSISLRGCTGFSGAGLAPLRSSAALELVDLRGTRMQPPATAWGNVQEQVASVTAMDSGARGILATVPQALVLRSTMTSSAFVPEGDEESWRLFRRVVRRDGFEWSSSFEPDTASESSSGPTTT